MKVISPTAMTDARLVSHSVPETDYAAWSSATTYVIGNRVIKGHKIWESLRVSNLNFDPETDITSPPYWILVSSTNRWKMFDQSVNSATTATASMTFDCLPGAINSVGLIELIGATVQVQILDGQAVVFDQTQNVDTTTLLDWQEYYFEPFDPASSLMFSDLPQFLTGTLRVTITGVGTVACGGVIFGRAFDLGATQFGASASIVDYSQKSTNTFGVTSVLKRAFSKRASVKLILDVSKINRVQGILADLRATPCLWVGTADTVTYAPLVIFGYFRDFSIDMTYARSCYCSIEIEGMT